MKNYSTIKKNEIISFEGKWMELKITTLSQISQTQKDNRIQRKLNKNFKVLKENNG
jgi:hypothetical protein